MTINTRHFGTLEIEDEKVLSFDEGLLGFEDCKKFILLKDEKDEGGEDDGLFLYLQSVDNPNASFALMNVFMVLPDYNPLIEASDIECLGEYTPDKYLVYNIVVIPENISELSVNLKAPVVINEDIRKGKQVIVNNEDYGVRYHIFEELKKMK